MEPCRETPPRRGGVWFPAALFCVLCIAAGLRAAGGKLTNPVVDTGQVRCCDDRTEIAFPAPGTARWGQDACYAGNATMFGANFADGRIKGYPVRERRGGRRPLVAG